MAEHFKAATLGKIMYQCIVCERIFKVIVDPNEDNMVSSGICNQKCYRKAREINKKAKRRAKDGERKSKKTDTAV